MKAVVCKQWGLPDTLVVEDVPAREPGPDEVRIRIRAAGVNFPDVLIVQKKYQIQPELPFTPGTEVSGDVISVGPGVTGFKPGDRVISFLRHRRRSPRRSSRRLGPWCRCPTGSPTRSRPPSR